MTNNQSCRMIVYITLNLSTVNITVNARNLTPIV